MDKSDLPFSVLPTSPDSFDSLAMKFRDQLDLVNAIYLLETLGAHVDAFHRAQQEQAISKEIPSFLSAFMPKSGGTYLHSRLVRMGAVEVFHGTQSPINYYQMHLIESWLKVFLKGGSVCHSHMAPSPRNLEILRRSEARKFWVHARDPRQSALSSYWHGKGAGQGTGAPAEQRLKEFDDMASQIISIGLKPFGQKPFDEEIKSHFLFAHQWASDWARARPFLPNIEFLFSTFEDFARDPRNFERNLFEFFEYRGADSNIFSDVDSGDRFRKGSVDEWKEIYSTKLQEWLRREIDPAVYECFGWKI